MRNLPIFSTNSKTAWRNYSTKKISGYLDWYFCDPKSKEIPIRNVSKLNKTEPHYEDLSFNLYNSCNQNLLQSALDRGDSFIFFFTKYVGKLKEFTGKHYITGYYKIGSVNDNGDRLAVHASKAVFLAIYDSIQMESFFDQKIENSRWIRKILDSKTTRDILKQFTNKKNRINDYKKITNKIKNFELK